MDLLQINYFPRVVFGLRPTRWHFDGLETYFLIAGALALCGAVERIEGCLEPNGRCGS